MEKEKSRARRKKDTDTSRASMGFIGKLRQGAREKARAEQDAAAGGPRAAVLAGVVFVEA